MWGLSLRKMGNTRAVPIFPYFKKKPPRKAAAGMNARPTRRAVTRLLEILKRFDSFTFLSCGAAGLRGCEYSSAVEIEKKRTAPKRAAPKKRPGTKARAEAVKSILRKVEDQMKKQTGKATLGDYIKLIQLAKEMTTDEPKTEIRVIWIDDPEDPSPRE
jgi:hypothetical protein